MVAIIHTDFSLLRKESEGENVCILAGRNLISLFWRGFQYYIPIYGDIYRNRSMRSRKFNKSGPLY